MALSAVAITAAIAPALAQLAAPACPGASVAAEAGTAGFPVGGRILVLHVRPGDRVVSGQLLAQLDTTALQRAEALAEAALAQSVAGAGGAVQRETPEMRRLRERLDMLRACLPGGLLVAPRAGRITARLANAGQQVAPGQPVFRIEPEPGATPAPVGPPVLAASARGTGSASASGARASRVQKSSR